MKTQSDAYYLEQLNQLAGLIHDRNVRLGFYDGGDLRPFDGLLMNVVAEVAEAQEEWRSGRDFNEHHWTIVDKQRKYDEPSLAMRGGKLHVRNYEWDFRGSNDTIPEWLEVTPELLRSLPNMIANLKPEGIPSELADIIIRVLDICAFHKIDIAHAIADKMAYNETRSYRHGGKKS